MKKAIVIGSGFAGISAASFLAKSGMEVQLFEKNAEPGGRAARLRSDGFTFDMGPSWYWMPDVFERYFRCLGKDVGSLYELERLDPSYRVYWEQGYSDIPADLNAFKAMLDSWEPGASKKLDKFLSEAAFKYKVGIEKLVFKPGLSLTEFMEWDVLKGALRLDLLTSIKKHIHKYFKHPRIRQILEFPVLFLGALPENTPALYSLMNYADIVGGTWYPKGGMYKVVEAMHRVALELGVRFQFNEPVEQILLEGNRAKGVRTSKGFYEADVVVGGADYQFIESRLLPETHRSYSPRYWEKRLMAPSSLLYYVGINKKIQGIPHHLLFFDVPFDKHAEEIYTTIKWPTAPSFYVSASSVTDPTVAPAGSEALVFLIPVAAGLADDTESRREKYFQLILKRFEKHIGQSVAENVVFKKSFAYSDFVNDYHSFKGNAYGLANTLMQTAIFRPSCRSKKVKNLFYTGQLTVPGPGVPPSLISGEVVAHEALKFIR